MNYRVPGLSSIIILFIGFGIAVYQLFMSSALLGLTYFIFIPVVFLNLLYHYCRKCPHVKNNSCRHVIFGQLTKKLFGILQPSKYTNKEILLALTPLLIIVLLPQYWLFKNKFLLIAFLFLLLIAFIIVRTGVCKGCQNRYCALHGKNK